MTLLMGHVAVNSEFSNYLASARFGPDYGTRSTVLILGLLFSVFTPCLSTTLNLKQVSQNEEDALSLNS